MSEQRSSRAPFGPADLSQLVTRPAPRTTRRLAKLTAPSAPIGALRKLVDSSDPLDLERTDPIESIPTVRYPSLRPDVMPLELLGPELEPGHRPPEPPSESSESSPFNRMSLAVVTDSSGMAVTTMPRVYWPFLLLFVVVVAAGATWLTLGLKVMAW
jgi:hypothetical protein